MLVAAVVCLCAAAMLATLGSRALARPAPADGTQQVLRSLAPTQLAAAVMLAAGGVTALSGQTPVGLLVLCVIGALGTVAAGAWQGARYSQLDRHPNKAATCRMPGDQACGSCKLSCR